MDIVVSLAKIFSDSNRLTILKMLETKPLCVCELAELLDVSPASVSRHLGVMVKQGIIAGEKDSFWTVYSLKITNSKARAMYGLISSWLDEDPVIKEQIMRIPMLDRDKVCDC